ncbi:MAG TPA: hypothetical protein VF306_15940 [Pirellulales bacterium]
MSATQSIAAVGVKNTLPVARPRVKPAEIRPSWRWQLSAPAWLVSLVFHALLVVLLGYVAQRELHGTGASPGAQLVASYSILPNESDLFDDEAVAVEVGAASTSDDAPNDEATPDAAQPSDDAAGGVRSVFDGPPPVDVRGALPSTTAASAGQEGPNSGLATGAGEFHRGGPKGPAKIGQGMARTGVYGIEAEGHSFVYIFDRSDSMGVGGGSPLASAKAQLIASLDDLTEQNQFHIIFYNTAPQVMDLGRKYGGLVFADEWAKGQARKHVQGITASGGTDHFLALQAGLKLHPDVIFFLTDADQPGLTRPQLERLNRLNSGRTSIYTIEFGDHPHSSRENFLGRIARENGGKYVYIDITKRGALRGK